jgi:hypothetical protein
VVSERVCVQDGFMSNIGGGFCGGFVRQVDGVVGHLLLVVRAEGIMAEGSVSMAVFQWSG